MENNPKKILTLCIIHQKNKVLLGMKKRGFGQGRWNGFGGKIKEGESIIDAANRELMEEIGIKVQDFQHLGVLDFSWKNKPEILQVHIFKASDFIGVPSESEEMKPEWFSVNEIPFQEMWQDDKHWLPLFLENKKFQGKFLFDDADNILDYSLDLV
ncbi:MAG: 8-oxo-dGTP diphosphatase [bacterium]|nr:8-oxo-dGTP diphosphatase [bacterium]